MHDTVLVTVGFLALWVGVGAVVAAYASSRQTELLLRQRSVSRAEPDSVDKDQRHWIAETDEDFETHLCHLAQQAATQRQRDLNRIRNFGA
jgi:hypothetical protein